MNYLEQNKEQFLEDLKGLIKIESYLKDPKVYPTKEVNEAVDYMINLAKKEGFKTYKQEEGYYGWIEIGSGDKLVGILGHLDVVPPGDELDKWDTPPFELTIEDGLLKGRGSQDDKGPVMLAFYLLKSIVASRVELNHRIRLIMPTDEESFWRGIEKYKADGQDIPNYGITPDATFPVIYSERELWEFKIKGPLTNDFTLKGGSALNVVPDKAEYTKGGINIIKEGKASHAMAPWDGDNAIAKIINEIDDNHPIINFIKNEINNETNGETLFGGLIKDDDEQLAVNMAVINIDESNSEVAFDLRIPNTSSAKELEEKVKSLLNEKYPELEFEHYDLLQGVYIPKDFELIKTVMETYAEVTGDNEAQPIATGGATYARGIENIVACGPFFNDSPITEHQYNEYARWEDFVKAFNIYEIVFNKLNK